MEVFRAACLIPLNQFEVWICRRAQHPSPPGFAFSKNSFLKQLHEGLGFLASSAWKHRALSSSGGLGPGCGEPSGASGPVGLVLS